MGLQNNHYKTCTKCKNEKHFSHFHKNDKSSDGRKTQCKECCNEYSAQYRVDNSRYWDEWRREHPDYFVEWYHNNKDKVRANNYPKYSIGDFDSLFREQKGRCAICGTHQSALERSLCIDHDHDTGRVRGLLCSTGGFTKPGYSCNLRLGHLGDNYENAIEKSKSTRMAKWWVEKAMRYLEANQ